MLAISNKSFFFWAKSLAVIGFWYANDFPKPKTKEHYGSLMKESLLDVEDDYFQNIATPLDQSIGSIDGQENQANEANVNNRLYI